MVGNPDFHSKQLKIIIKFPLQNFVEKPQASSYADIYNTGAVLLIYYE